MDSLKNFSEFGLVVWPAIANIKMCKEHYYIKLINRLKKKFFECLFKLF